MKRIIFWDYFFWNNIKKFLYSEFKTLTKSDKSSVSKILESLKCDLKQNNFHGSYFDRSAESEDRICDRR